MPIYCKLLTLCFDFNDSIIIQLSYIRAFTHKLPWLDQYRLILCYNRQLTIIAGGYGFTGIKQKEGVSKQSNWHILFLFCFVFQKSFKPPILD